MDLRYMWARYSASLRAGESGDRIPVGARFFHNRLEGPWGLSTLFPGGVKRPGRGTGHPRPI